MSRLALACLGLLSAGSFSAAQTTTQPASQEEAKKQLVALVDKAAELVASKGEEAFAEFRKPGSEWKHDEVYIFVTRSDGMAVVHPTLEGQNMLDLKDTEGKLIVRDMMKAVETQDSGWTEYMWPKPGATEPSKKSSYVRKVKSGDATYIVGAGVYLD
jgi:signal transduction histidine kinase